MGALEKKDPSWGSLGRTMMVLNTGRCGSTIFSKALDNLASVCSLSEPDM